MKHCVCEKIYIWNPSTCDCEIKYAYMKNVIDDSVVPCDEIIDVVAKSQNDTSESVLTNSDDNKNIKLIIIFCTLFC